MPAVVNAANEIAVSAFLDGRIGFGDISKINRSVMLGHKTVRADKIENVLDADKEARQSANALVVEMSRAAIAA